MTMCRFSCSVCGKRYYESEPRWIIRAYQGLRVERFCHEHKIKVEDETDEEKNEVWVSARVHPDDRAAFIERVNAWESHQRSYIGGGSDARNSKAD